MTEITIEQANHLDVGELLADLREADRLELEIGTGESAEKAIVDSLNDSNGGEALRFNGTLAAITGLAYAGIVNQQHAGCPWLVGTNSVDSFKLSFMRWSHDQIQYYLEQYEVLINLVHVDHATSISYLDALGFTMAEAVEFGPSKALFYPFYLERSE